MVTRIAPRKRECPSPLERFGRVDYVLWELCHGAQGVAARIFDGKDLEKNWLGMGTTWFPVSSLTAP